MCLSEAPKAANCEPRLLLETPAWGVPIGSGFHWWGNAC